MAATTEQNSPASSDPSQLDVAAVCPLSFRILTGAAATGVVPKLRTTHWARVWKWPPKIDALEIWAASDMPLRARMPAQTVARMRVLIARSCGLVNGVVGHAG